MAGQTLNLLLCTQSDTSHGTVLDILTSPALPPVLTVGSQTNSISIPGNLLETHILRPHSSPTKTDPAKDGGPQSVFGQALRAVLVYLRSRKHCSGEGVGETDVNRWIQVKHITAFFSSDLNLNWNRRSPHNLKSIVSLMPILFSTHCPGKAFIIKGG